MRRVVRVGSRRRILLLALAAFLTTGCQAPASGWVNSDSAAQSHTEVATAYALPADQFAIDVDAAYRAFSISGPDRTRTRLAAYYAASAAATWRLATSVASIRADALVEPALGAVISLAAGESATLRMAAESSDPAGALGAVLGDALGGQHRATVNRLRAMLGLPPSRTDVNYFY